MALSRICPLSSAPQLHTASSLCSSSDSLPLRLYRQREIKYSSTGCVFACSCCRLCRGQRHNCPLLCHEQGLSVPREISSGKASVRRLSSTHGEGGPGIISAWARGALQTWGPTFPFDIPFRFSVADRLLRLTCHHQPSLWPLPRKQTPL